MKRRTGQKMRKKIKESPIRFQITAAMCLSAAAILLGGCSLAVPGAGTEEAGDRLIGLFITPESLDLYDTEGDLQDHGAQLMNQDEIILENDPDYAERLYADIDRQGKEDPSEWEVTFGKVPGIRFFTPLWTDENGETYWGNVTDEELCDVRINVNTTDQGEERELEGSFYFLPGQMDKDIAYYPNPVFQTADGRIYTTSGSGFGTSGDSADGIKLTKSFASETTTEESGKVTTDKSTVTINLGTKNKPLKVILVQMDQEHRVKSQQEYVPGQLPETLALEADTAYLVAETWQENLAGEPVVSRQLVEQGEEETGNLTTFYEGENGIMKTQDTYLQWNSGKEA